MRRIAYTHTWGLAEELGRGLVDPDLGADAAATSVVNPLRSVAAVGLVTSVLMERSVGTLGLVLLGQSIELRYNFREVCSW